MSRQEDHVLWRITVEYGRRYVYLTLTDANGNLVKDHEECFTQPFMLDKKDAKTEASDTWHATYDWLNDTIVFPLPEGGGKASDSGKED